MERHLRQRELLDDTQVKEFAEEAETMAADLRARLAADPVPAPLSLFDHVYHRPTPQLREQRAMVEWELGAGEAAAGEGGR
jgi:pyruvate dehydrogenase E1 component alpha subunit